jgi:hypothetical protein
MVPRIVLGLLLIAWLRSPVVASPSPPDEPHHDRDGAPRAPVAQATDTPWIDLSPPRIVSTEPVAEPRRDRGAKIASAVTVGGVYAGLTTWMYFAWYYNKQRNEERCPTDGEKCGFRWGGDRWFQADTYAGGADKLGHGWATMGLARWGTEVLHQWGGYSMLTASLIGCGLAEAMFFLVEVKDGAYYEFSFGDLTFNSAGALLAFAMSNVPRLDEMIDFRVQFYPSRAYRRQLTNDGNVNIAEDYTGQTYLLAYHLSSIHRLRDSKWGGWSRFVDLAVGFETRGYKPDPLPTEPDFDHRQKLFLGVTLNAQGLFDYLLKGKPRKVTHGLFEFFNVPYTTAPIVDTQRNVMSTDSGGA